MSRETAKNILGFAKFTLAYTTAVAATAVVAVGGAMSLLMGAALWKAIDITPPDWVYKMKHGDAVKEMDQRFLQAAWKTANACGPVYTPYQMTDQLVSMTSRTSYLAPAYRRVTASVMNDFLAALDRKDIALTGALLDGRSNFHKFNNTDTSYDDYAAIYYNGTLENPSARTLVLNDYLTEHREKRQLLPVIELEILNRNLAPGEIIVIEKAYNNGDKLITQRLAPGQSTLPNQYRDKIPPNPCLNR